MDTHAPHARAAPLGGRLVTPTFLICLGVVAVAFVLLSVRFALGLGSVTAMNDGYPWGIWIAWDVVVGTALSTGGYAMALLVYVLNRGRYHPLVRSALLISALGYTLAGYSVLIDLGRWWNMWEIPVLPWRWNGESVLLEVALCVMLYTGVLWLEVSPALLERARRADMPPRLRAFATRATPLIEKALPWVIALGVLLPTMHQSSLGSLMLLAGHKLHPLWQTPFLPLLFLLSSIALGYAAVVMESTLTSKIFRLPGELPLLRGLRPAAVLATALWLVVRLADVARRGQLDAAFALEWHSMLFLVELALALASLVVLTRGRSDAPTLFRGAMLLVASGLLYRLSAFLIAFDPGQGWRYFPSVGEVLVTLGLIAGEIASYLVLVKLFPILVARPMRPRTVAPPPSGLAGVPDAVPAAMPAVVPAHVSTPRSR
jgi:Ni/Fe-hydrogenase subunit HybB-like protein